MSWDLSPWVEGGIEEVYMMVGFAGSLIWDMLRTYQWQFKSHGDFPKL